MAAASEVILSGGSAGGLSVFLGIDYVRSLLPSSNSSLLNATSLHGYTWLTVILS